MSLVKLVEKKKIMKEIVKTMDNHFINITKGLHLKPSQKYGTKDTDFLISEFNNYASITKIKVCQAELIPSFILCHCKI